MAGKGRRELALLVENEDVTASEVDSVRCGKTSNYRDISIDRV